MQHRPLATLSLVAIASFALTLAALWPRATFAEAIADSERQGEWDEDGAKFGDVVIRGDLVADGNGWVLVRTIENKSDEPRTCRVEERVSRTETMPGARVLPPPYTVLMRGVTITLAAHEKRKMGLPLPAAISAQITANMQLRTTIETKRARAIALEHYRDPVFDRTYMEFGVDYYKPLPPGATVAEPEPTLITRPAAYPMVAPPPRRASDGGAPELEVGF